MNKRLLSAITFGIILLAAIVPGGASTSDEMSANQSIQFVSQIGGVTDAVAVQGNYAYIGIGARLAVINIANPAAPVLTGQTGLLGADVKGIAVAGNYAYVAAGTAGLRIVNISDPANPVEVGFYDSPGTANGVAVAGYYAYVADGVAGLRVVSIWNPANPASAGFYNTPGNANCVAVAGNYAYVADGAAGLRVISILNPTSPTEVGFYVTPGPARGVAVAGDYAYLADDASGLRVLNVSDPAQPTQAGFAAAYSSGLAVAVAGDYASVATDYTGVRVYNVADPSKPTALGELDTPGRAKGVAMAGTKAYVAGNTGGLRIVDTSGPNNPSEVGFYPSMASVADVVVSGNLAYVADAVTGLQIIDISDPSRPALIGFPNTPTGATSLALVGNLIYTVDFGGLSIFNVSDPEHPVRLGSRILGETVDLAVAGSYAYVTEPIVSDEAWGDLIVVNVSNPANPSVVRRFRTEGGALTNDITVSGSTLYTAEGSRGLHIANVSDPSNPAYLTRYDALGSAMGVKVAGNLAYVVGYDGLYILNVADPGNPTEVGHCAAPTQGWGVAVAGNYAYVADGNNGVRVIRVSDPAHPAEVGSYDTIGRAVNVAVQGQYIYVADSGGGLTILRMEGEPTPTPTATPTPTQTPTATPTRTPGGAQPRIVSVNPPCGRSNVGQKVTFTTVFEDADGANDLKLVYFIVNEGVSYINGAGLAYNLQVNKMVMRNDANTAWIVGAAPGSGGNLDTARATLHVGECSAVKDGTRLTVTWVVTFKQPMSPRALNMHMVVVDYAHNHSSWQTVGSWGVGTTGSPPCVGDVTPSSGSGLAGDTVYFSTTFADPDGASDLKTGYFLVSAIPSTSGQAVYLAYNQNVGQMFLRNDANSAWLGGFAPGSAHTLENSRVILDVANSAAVIAGQGLTVTWALQFKPAFAGQKNLYACALDDRNYYAAWQKKGAWEIIAP